MDTNMQNLNTNEMTGRGVIVLNVSEMPQENISVGKGKNYLLVGDNSVWLKKIPNNSIDSIVTDPPAGISFMGRGWDTDKGGRDNWIAWMCEVATECKRVLKPGGHAFVWAIPRTSHWTATAWENAGFEIRDVVTHIFGSGFPKSLNIGKAVDKLQGNEREVTGSYKVPDIKGDAYGTMNEKQGGSYKNIEVNKTKGTSEWEGWGTALKPAREDWILMRKPLEKGLTIAENVLKYGTGGLNIDGCRVGTEEITTQGGDKFKGDGIYNKYATCKETTHTGRWPANLIHDGSDEVLECFPNTKPSKIGKPRGTFKKGLFANSKFNKVGTEHNDSGSAARFFYCAKASKKDRDEGLDCTRTVKYNGSINPNKELCKEENMVAVQLLQRVISEPELVSFSIGESGVNIMAQCQSGSLSTIKTTISKIIESKILNLLTLSLTSGFTEDASLEKMSGGSHAESVGSLKKWLLTITNGQSALALGASDVALKMLLQIRNEENWNQSRNIHSTVKPTALMRYLVKLVTPPGGTVLDPFTGSGSTGKACKLEGFEFIGIEREEEYVKIAEARIKAVIHQPTLV